jgi:hypothetical protein
MDGTAARQEADKILAELPDRISDVIKPFVRHSPEHPAIRISANICRDTATSAIWNVT